MARRKTNGADTLTAIVSRMPWWVGVLLAAVSYVLLHRIAESPASPIVPGQMAGGVASVMGKTFASIGQYILPFICIIGAAASAYGRRRRETMITEVASATKSNAASLIDGMSWQDFELLVGEAFRLQGYKVKETGSGGADGGIDLQLTKNGETFLVQCKQWKAFSVGVTVVRELFGVMAAQGAAGGFVVTSGRFTQQAKSFASGRNLQLIDGPRLFDMIARVRSANAAPAAPGR